VSAFLKTDNFRYHQQHHKMSQPEHTQLEHTQPEQTQPEQTQPKKQKQKQQVQKQPLQKKDETSTFKLTSNKVAFAFDFGGVMSNDATEEGHDKSDINMPGVAEGLRKLHQACPDMLFVLVSFAGRALAERCKDSFAKFYSENEFTFPYVLYFVKNREDKHLICSAVNASWFVDDKPALCEQVATGCSTIGTNTLTFSGDCTWDTVVEKFSDPSTWKHTDTIKSVPTKLAYTTAFDVKHLTHTVSGEPTELNASHLLH
jgi:hypothetical protein